jgi:hypothetical protein
MVLLYTVQSVKIFSVCPIHNVQASDRNTVLFSRFARSQKYASPIYNPFRGIFATLAAA